MRWIPLDRVTELVPGERAAGLKAVSLADGVLLDHFPGLPLLPGALVLEAAAQLAGLLLEVTRNQPGSGEPLRALLVGVDRARFRKPAEPGDVLTLTANLAADVDGAARVNVAATVGDDPAMDAVLTFLLRAVDAPELHARRRELYRTWTRGLGPIWLP